MAVVGSELTGEILGTGHDVITDILAVSSRSIPTLVLGQLHETLFAIPTDGGRIAATLLESDRSQEDGRKSELVTILLEGPNVIAAASEGATLSDGVVEVLGDQITDLDEGRTPSSTIDTAVQPIKRSVGTGGLGDLLGSTVGSAVAVLNLDNTVCVWVGSGTWARSRA